MSNKRRAKSVYFEPKLESEIDKICKKYNLSFSAVVSDAVEKQIRKSKGEADDIDGKLKNLSTALHQHRERTSQDIYLVTELLLSFVKHSMITTPDIPEEEMKAATAIGNARFEKWLEGFQQSILTSGGTSKEIFKDEE